MRKLTTEEIEQRVLNSGVDARMVDKYVKASIPITFSCSKGHIWKTKVGNIIYNHQGCPFCSGRYPIVGKNDLWTTHPEIAKLLVKPEDGYTLSRYSGKKRDFKCANCGTISTHIVGNIVKRGLSCPVCSDGISYPNKFAASMLTQLKVKYCSEFTFPNSRYRYDFYLPNHSVIVEMHGRQHYEEWQKSEKSLEEQKQNDINKMQFAESIGIKKYIVIDARNSDISYISKNILKSELNNLFNLSIVDWRKCGYYASGSLVAKAAELYNDGKNVKEIAEEIGCSTTTIHDFLHKATDIGLCNWVKDTGSRRPDHAVVLLNTNEIFSCMSDGARKYNVCIANISANCLGRRKHAGIMPTTGEQMTWCYLEDYNNVKTIN